MKVLHVIPSVAPVRGGPSAAMGSIEQALISAGVEVETATTNDDGPGRRSGGTAEALEKGVLRRTFNKDLDFYCYSRGLSDWLEQNVRRYDIIHTHGMFVYPPLAGARAARRFGVPYVMRPLGTLMRQSFANHRLRKRISLSIVEGRAITAASALHVTSAAERADLATLRVRSRPAVIPLAVEPPAAGDVQSFLAKHPETARRRRILYLSRLDPLKNLESLLDALPSVRSSIPDACLIVCGDGPAEYADRLKQRAEALGLSGHVFWTGFVTGADKADALAAGEIFVLPSFSESFGVAAVEALYAGLPCILGRGVAIAGEIAEAGVGQAVEPGPSKIAAAIIHALSSVSRGQRERASSFAQTNYSPPAMGGQLKNLYRDILDGRLPSAVGGH